MYMRNWINKLYNKQISGLGLAVFRICFCIVMLCEIIQMYYFRHLIYDKIPYIEHAEINFAIPLVIWAISIILMILGLFTRTATIINYLFTLVLIGSIQSYEYHMFYAYVGMSFIMIFLPISRNLSLDRLLLKYKYSNTKFNYNPPTTVSVLTYYVPILIGIAFVYFDSVFFKLSSNYWSTGLGMWLPSSVPHTAMIPLPNILNLKYLMLFLGYLTLMFEAIFLFTFFRKKWRIPLLIIGLGLHLGILICYPIPWFALGMCAVYLLMVPVGFWERIFTPKNPTPAITFYYDGECPLCNRTKLAIQHFDVLKKVDFKTVQYFAEQQPLLKDTPYDTLLDDIHSIRKDKVYTGLDTYIQVLDSMVYTKPLSWLIRLPGIYNLGKAIYGFVAKNRNTERCTEDNCGYTPPVLPVKDEKMKILQSFTLRDLKVSAITYGLSILVILQVIVSYNSPLNKNIRQKIHFEKTIINKQLELISKKVEKQTKPLLGITGHGVFMDYHFSEYNHVIAVVYKDKNNQEKWLPIIDQDGTPGDYLFGPTWTKWSFRVCHNKINQTNLEKGIRDFTAFWAYKNGVNLQDANFIIKVKNIDTPTTWKKDFLKDQMEKPWQDVGIANWRNNQFSIDIPIIESL